MAYVSVQYYRIETQMINKECRSQENRDIQIMNLLQNIKNRLK